MRAEESHPRDYRVIEMLSSLIKLQDIDDERTFGIAMLLLWETLTKKVPEELRGTDVWLVLDAYFKVRGDLRSALRHYERQLEESLGYVTHREAMERLKNRTTQIEAQMKEIFNPCE